jgi:MYXO-CTERM domain-containing protein
MRNRFVAAACATLAALGLLAHAAPTTFTYTQDTSLLGAGTIAAFQYDPGDGLGPISFGPTVMPAAVVRNENPGLTPATHVGAQTTAAGASNEANTATGLLWSGNVTATGTRGAQVFTMQIPLKFVPKVTQAPDSDDYNWNIAFGDNQALGGTDTASTSVRMAIWLSRDDVVDAAETANTFQRYTQQNHTFVAGAQDSFSNTNTTLNVINDATDPPGNPQGVDAAGRDLAFYFGWRDQGALSAGAVLIDNFTVGGILNADEATLSPPVPEPGMLGLAGIAVLGLLRRRRNA